MAGEKEHVQPVFANIYTDFFKRDPQMYALGDIRFNKPKSLKTVGYTLALLLLWGLPAFMIIGPENVLSNIFFAAIVVGPPVGLGMVMGKPLFHNKPLMKDLKSIFKYTQEANVYAGLVEFEYDKTEWIDVDGTVWLADRNCYDEDEDLNGPGSKNMKSGKTKASGKKLFGRKKD